MASWEIPLFMDSIFPVRNLHGKVPGFPSAFFLMTPEGKSIQYPIFSIPILSTFVNHSQLIAVKLAIKIR